MVYVAHLNGPRINDNLHSTRADLEQAVRRASLADVFAILTEWSIAPAMLNSEGKTDYGHTADARHLALRLKRADIVSILLMAAPLPANVLSYLSASALDIGYIENFQALLYNGWDINEQQGGLGGPAALG